MLDVTRKIFSFIENTFGFKFLFSERMEEEHKDLAINNNKKEKRKKEKHTEQGEMELK